MRSSGKKYQREYETLAAGTVPTRVPKSIDLRMSQFGTIILALGLSVMGALLVQLISRLLDSERMYVDYLNAPGAYQFTFDTILPHLLQIGMAQLVAIGLGWAYFSIYSFYHKRQLGPEEPDLPWLDEYKHDTDYLMLRHGKWAELSLGTVKRVVTSEPYPGIYLHAAPMASGGTSRIKFIPLTEIHTSEVVSREAMEVALASENADEPTLGDEGEVYTEREEG